jgi:hypothetical protein
MKKRVKNGIVKVYCDRCGKNIYDEIPKEPTVKLMGQFIPEVAHKRHCEFRMLMASRKKGIKAGLYCLDCAEAITK